MPRIGGKRERAKLTYSSDTYTPYGLTSLSEPELRKEYSRLRSIAVKRLKRFEKTEYTDTDVYKYNKDRYVKLKELKSETELRHRLSDVARFLEHQTSSVSGLNKQRNRAIQTLNDSGYKFVNKKNYKKFFEFMEYARASTLGRMYDSKRVAEFFETMEEGNYSEKEMQDAFRSWKRNEKKLGKVQNNKTKSAKDYRKALD